MQLMHAIYTLTFIEIAIIELTSCINNPSMNTVITLFLKNHINMSKKSQIIIIIIIIYYFEKYNTHFFKPKYKVSLWHNICITFKITWMSNFMFSIGYLKKKNVEYFLPIKFFV